MQCVPVCVRVYVWVHVYAVYSCIHFLKSHQAGVGHCSDTTGAQRFTSLFHL